MNRRVVIVFRQPFRNQNRVFKVVAAPRHERHQHVSSQGEFAAIGARSVGNHLAFGNALTDVTYAWSTDGGATWSSTRVSTSGFDPGLAGVPNRILFPTAIRPFIGDYNGIASLPDRAVMTWTGLGPQFGFLNDNLEIFFGSVTP